MPKAKYSKSTGGVYLKSAFETFPEDALDIPDAIYEKFINSEISAFDIVNGKVVALLPLPPTQQQLMQQDIDAVRDALQRNIDAKAREFGFTDGNSFMLYAGFENSRKIQATIFAKWESGIWDEAEAYKAQVIAGKKPMPTGEQAVAMMPAYPQAEKG